MVTILTIENEFESAETLGYKTVLFCKKNIKDVVIRWGNSESCGSKDFKKVVNPGKAIALNCHKLDALRKMSKVVHTPEIFTKKVPSGKLALIRPISHSNGEDFNVVKGPYEIPEEYYGTAWIATKTEFRVWFAWGQTLCAERIDLDAAESPYPCRSGWGYKKTHRTPRTLHRAVMRAAKAIGLHVGAADVLVKDGKFIFLELNSAPTIDAKSVRKFFQAAISGRYNRKRKLVTK